MNVSAVSMNVPAAAAETGLDHRVFAILPGSDPSETMMTTAAASSTAKTIKAKMSKR